MKNLLLVIACVLTSNIIFGQNDAITKYFNQYKDDKRFTMVEVSPKLFQMVANVASEEIKDPELIAMIKDMRGLKILQTEDSPNEFYNEAIAKINTKEYEEFLTVRDDGQNIKFLVKDAEDGNLVNELLLIVGGDDEFVLLSFVGKIYLDKIGKLARSMDIEGLEHLDKLDKD
ncbi:MAG: DUF4252 domain-containing protein [Saprospiraceae bacterium]|nr:DUF4252 domain-containing protein [Bacteroidia bacterium]NNE14991.1 DUF4252 domain-containing protein [Saprospiraceae bacterium]NNL93374.1 DUF4252 domain-containing protein [Saprospiraceae bacterium]